MKIALVAPSFIPSTRANTIQTMKMADAFAGLGNQVCVWVPGHDPQAGSGDLAQHYGLRHSFEIRYIDTIHVLRRYDFGWRAFKAAQRWKADLLLTRLPQAAAFASRAGFPVVYEAHDLPGGRMGRFLFRAFLAGRGARGLVAISHALASDLHPHFSAPLPGGFTKVLPDGVDLERYQDLPDAAHARRLLGLPETFTAGYTGHLYAGRGIALILALAHALPEMQFLIVGGRSEDVDQVERQASANVTLTGFVPNAQLPRYQAACDVLLMPYQNTVAASSGGNIAAYLSPMKLFEYLASARPILASDLPVLSEVLVHQENALIMPAADITLWAEALQALEKDSSLVRRLSASARAAAEEHTWDRRAAAILSFDKSLTRATDIIAP
jgi:glycosyltransferase involved in cell wall biosynthesis